MAPSVASAAAPSSDAMLTGRSASASGVTPTVSLTPTGGMIACTADCRSATKLE